ncbi:hypothetical protein GCM10009534_49120 [Kribbella sandramycini]
MALGKQPDEHPLDQLILPDDDPLHLEQRVFEGSGRYAGTRNVSVGHALPAGLF